jgi:hypothetical protein
LELGGAVSRTLDQFERDLSRGCLMFPSKDTTGLDDGDAVQIAKSFKPGERRVRVAWRSFYKWGCAHGAANEMRKKARTGFEPVYAHSVGKALYEHRARSGTGSPAASPAS